MKALPQTTPITQAMLPGGWTLDDSPMYHGSTILCAPEKQGYLSIDVEIRAWDFGTCPVHFKHSQPVFKGRGWLQALIDAAIKDFNAKCT